MAFDINTLKAAELYLLRTTTFERPEGTWKKGRFYPTGRDMDVLADVRAPSRAYPYSYLKACYTFKHCAAYQGATDVALVRKASKLGLSEVRNQISALEGRY